MPFARFEILGQIAGKSELDPALMALVREARTAPPVHTLPVAVARAGLRSRFAGLAKSQVGATEDLTIESYGRRINLRIYRPDGMRDCPVLVFFHGGGFVLGDLETHDALSRRLCADAGLVLVAVDYALAPELPFPAGLDDCVSALRWILDHASVIGGSDSRLALAGDSAGGNLAIASYLSLTAGERSRFKALMLVYPVVDAPNLSRPSYVDYGDGYGLTAQAMLWFFAQYLGRSGASDNPLIAPIRSERLNELPATWLLSAEFDPIRDEIFDFANRLESVGVDVTHVHQANANHGFFGWAGNNTPSQEALSRACDWLTSRLD